MIHVRNLFVCVRRSFLDRLFPVGRLERVPKEILINLDGHVQLLFSPRKSSYPIVWSFFSICFVRNHILFSLSSSLNVACRTETK